MVLLISTLDDSKILMKAFASLIIPTAIVFASIPAFAEPVLLKLTGKITNNVGSSANIDDIVTADFFGLSSARDHKKVTESVVSQGLQGVSSNNKPISALGLNLCKKYATENKQKLGTPFTILQTFTDSSATSMVGETTIPVGKFKSGGNISIWSTCKMYYDVKIDKTTGKTSGIMGFVVKTSGAFNQNKVIGQMAESFPEIGRAHV